MEKKDQRSKRPGEKKDNTEGATIPKGNNMHIFILSQQDIDREMQIRTGSFSPTQQTALFYE